MSKPIDPKNDTDNPETANLQSSLFQDVNLHKARFINVNLTESKFHNINMSDATFTALQMGGCTFRHIGLPLKEDGSQDKQKGLIFEEAHLNDSIIKNCLLTNVKITNCTLTGMKIDGIDVEKMIAFYKENKKHS
jgi:uncharacterized protein YjbI with pentapeptide repeats